MTRIISLLAALVLSGEGLSFAQSLSAVQVRCARLEAAAKSATGPMRDVFAQALDDCRAEKVKLSPPKTSKFAKLAADSASLLAISQEGWAMHQNLHSMEHMRPKQRGVGTYQFNMGSEAFVMGVLSEGLASRWWKRWHHKPVPVVPLDVTAEATDAVVLPH